MKRKDVKPGEIFRYIEYPGLFVARNDIIGVSFERGGVRIYPSDPASSRDLQDRPVELLDADTLKPVSSSPDSGRVLSTTEDTGASASTSSGLVSTSVRELRHQSAASGSPTPAAGAQAGGTRPDSLRDRSHESASHDATNPSHYAALSIEPIDAIESWGLGYNLGNVVAYIARAGRKPHADALSGHPRAVSAENDAGAGGAGSSSETAAAGSCQDARPAGDTQSLREGARADLRKALKYLIREITGLDGNPSWDYANVANIKTVRDPTSCSVSSGGRDA